MSPAAPLFIRSAGGLIVELEGSGNIMIVERRLPQNGGDVRIHVTNIDGLVDALHRAREVRDVAEQIQRERQGNAQPNAQTIVGLPHD